MQLPFSFSLATAFVVSSAFAVSASAETAAFPKPDPVFTLTVPNDCNVEFKDNEMWIKAQGADEIAYFMFRELPQAEVYDRDSAVKFLEPYAWAQIRSMGVTDGRFRMFGNTSLGEGIYGFDILLQGTWNAAPGGSTKVSFQATAFSADATQYFLLVSLGRWGKPADRGREEELEKSMRAVERNPRTLGFPKDDPAFTIRLSQDWKADTSKEKSMEVSSAKGGEISTLWQKFNPRGTTLESDSDREKFTVEWIEGIAKQLEMSELKAVVPITSTTVAGKKAFTAAYEGVMDGVPHFLDVITFTPDGTRHFLAYGVAPQQTGKGALEHQREIFESIKPVGKQP